MEHRFREGSGGRSGGGGRFGGGGRSGGGFRRDFGPREMHKIKCTECGKDAEVPFRPKEGLPVFCRECFFKKKGITPREPRESEESEPTAEAKTEEVKAEEVKDSEEF
ncbi:CxxC-x17-CxxC domain-containing protein [Nanoarchaeota archaeon]